MIPTTIDEQLVVDLPEQCPSSVTSREGFPDVHRYFLGAVVVAAALERVERDPVESVELAAGELISRYRVRPGYSRTAQRDPEIEGADASCRLDLRWCDDNGVPMSSVVVIAATGRAVATVHAASPTLLGPTVEAEAAAIAMSMRLRADGSAGSAP